LPAAGNYIYHSDAMNVCDFGPLPGAGAHILDMARAPVNASEVQIDYRAVRPSFPLFFVP